MAESNKPRGHPSKPAPPPWVNNQKVRRNTTQTQPPPKATGTNRRPPPKPKVPKVPPKRHSGLYKATVNNNNNNNNNNNTKSKPLKRASLQHTTLSQVMRKQNSMNDMIKSKSYPKNIIRSKSPPPPTNNINIEKSVSASASASSRWKNHPHAMMFDEKKSNKIHPPAPPAPGQQKRHKPVSIKKKENDINRKYMKNIAGFDEITLNAIDECNIEVLLGCMHEGSECLKHFHKALTTFAKQQQTQCANFLKLFKKSKSRYAQMDTMPNFFYAISLIHTLLEETVKQSAEFAKFIQISCLPMISELEIQCDDKYKQIYNLTKIEDKQLCDLKSNVEKQRKICKTAADKVIIARQKKEFQKNKPITYTHNKAKSNKHNILSNVSDIIATNKALHNSSNINDAYSIAKEQEKKFKLSVSEYNHNRIEYINKRNEGKHEIINMEHFRVDSMLTVFKKIVNQQQKSSQKENNKVYQLQNDIVIHTESMKAKNVLNKFINLSLETHKEWKQPEAVESTLEAMEYRDMFHSIDDAMNITLEINKDATIPLIIPLLCERIKDLNGFKTEGIFRKSPNKSNMLRIKKRLQVKNFQLDENNVHVYSSLLKNWLRDLDDLIIPKRYYDYCVSMAKENKLNQQQFEVFVSQLPSVNRECLKYLIKFLRELLKPQYQQFTKMNIENVAIVFAPTLLNCPLNTDPQQILANSKHEKAFTIAMLQQLQTN